VWGGGRVHAILGRHLTDAKGRLKRQILKHVQMQMRMGCYIRSVLTHDPKKDCTNIHIAFHYSKCHVYKGPGQADILSSVEEGACMNTPVFFTLHL